MRSGLKYSYFPAGLGLGSETGHNYFWYVYILLRHRVIEKPFLLKDLTVRHGYNSSLPRSHWVPSLFICHVCNSGRVTIILFEKLICLHIITGNKEQSVKMPSNSRQAYHSVFIIIFLALSRNVGADSYIDQTVNDKKRQLNVDNVGNNAKVSKRFKNIKFNADRKRMRGRSKDRISIFAEPKVHSKLLTVSCH